MSYTNKFLNETKLDNKNLLQENKRIVNRWQRYGLLEGIKNEYEKNGLAILLENQAKQLLKEASDTGTVSNSEEWSGVALPLVRRVFSDIAAKDFVSVQPMSLPSGLIFYMDFKYGTSQPGFTANAGKDSQTDSVFGVTDTSNDASGGFYGAGRYNYTRNDVSGSALTWAATANATKFSTGSVTAEDYNFNTLFSSSKAGLLETQTVKLTISTASLDNPDLDSARAYKVSGSGIVGYFPEFTKVSSDETEITFLVSGSAPVNAVISYHKQPTDITRGDFEAGKTQEEPIDIPQLNIDMRSIPIVAETRKLKAIWTPEFAQDLNAYHALDAEAELTSMLSEYISHEIDLEILDMLNRNVRTKGYWSTNVGRVWNGSAFADMTTIQAQASAYTQQTWFQTLGTTIKKVSNVIHQKTMRGGANFMVVSPTISTILESMNGYQASNTHDETQTSPYAFGVQQIGQFAGKINVYKNPYFFENKILMGYRGSQFLETGAVFAPYIPLIMTPLVVDPDDFTPRKGVMTRFAKKVVRPEFFGSVTIEGLERI